jgi:hypothetical protein
MANKIYRDPKTGRITGIPIGEEAMASRPICARFPVDVDETLRNIPNRSEFIRAVVTEAVRKLNKDE